MDLKSTFPLATRGLDYQAIYRTLPRLNIIFLPDSPKFTIGEISNDFCSFLGQTEEDLIGRSVFEAFPPNPADTEFTGHKNLLASLNLVLSRKVQHRMERQRYDVEIEEGGFKQIYWSNVSIPVLNDAGEVLYIIHLPEDITEKVIAEQREMKIKGIEKAYNLFMQVPMVIGVNTGENHVLELANEGAFKLWGKGPEIIGKPLIETLPELEGQGIFELFDKVRQTGEPYIGKEVPVITYAEGRKKQYYFDLIYQPIYEDDSDTAGVFTLSHDVIELKEARAKIQESEERARLAVESADLGTYEVDLLTNEIVASTRMAAIFDLEENANREQFVAAIFPEDLPIREQAYIKAFETGLLDYKGRIVKKNGELSWIYVKGRIFYNENNLPIRLLGVVQDITETKKFEDTLALRNTQLTRTNKDLDNFIYTASHDLRSPIANIERLILVLQEELAEETSNANKVTADVLTRIINSVDRLKNTINDLAQVTRLKHDQTDLNRFDNVNIREVYEEIIADLVLPINIKPYKIDLDLAVESLTFSKKNFRSILYNLISNAIKYQSPERECRIQVSTWEDLSYTVLSVKDNGLGINKQNLDKLFSMFKRFHDHVEGTGIGLYMVKRITEDAGGKITVKSNEDEGTEFRVYFPQKS